MRFDGVAGIGARSVGKCCPRMVLRLLSTAGDAATVQRCPAAWYPPCPAAGHRLLADARYLGREWSSSGQTGFVLLHDPAGELNDLDVGVLRGPHQQGERLRAGEVLAVHQDALGLPDDVAAGQRRVELRFGFGPQHRDGRVLGQDGADQLAVVVEGVGVVCLQVERTEILFVDEQPK